MTKVRALRKKDIPQMISLYSEFLKDQSDKNKYCHISYAPFCKKTQYYENMINSEHGKIFIGEDAGTLVGCMAVLKCTPDFLFEFDSYAYLCDGFVKENYRISKLSFYLYEACEQWAKENNCKYLAAYAYASNKKAQIGFQAKKLDPYKITYIKEIK